MVEILSKLEDYFEIEESSDAKRTMSRLSVDALGNFFASSESSGNCGILACSALDRGVYVKDISIDITMTAKPEAAKNIFMSTYSSMSVWDLKTIIAEKTGISPLCI